MAIQQHVGGETIASLALDNQNKVWLFQAHLCIKRYFNDQILTWTKLASPRPSSFFNVTFLPPIRTCGVAAVQSGSKVARSTFHDVLHIPISSNFAFVK